MMKKTSWKLLAFITFIVLGLVFFVMWIVVGSNGGATFPFLILIPACYLGSWFTAPPKITKYRYQVQTVGDQKFQGSRVVIFAVVRWLVFTWGGITLLYFLFVLYTMNFSPSSNYVCLDDELCFVLAVVHAGIFAVYSFLSFLVGMLVDVALDACIVYTVGRTRQLVWLTCLLCFAANGIITWFALTNAAQIYNSTITLQDLQIFDFPTNTILWLSFLSALIAYLSARTYPAP